MQFCKNTSSAIDPTKNQDDVSLDDNCLADGVAKERCLAEDVSFRKNHDDANSNGTGSTAIAPMKN